MTLVLGRETIILFCLASLHLFIYKKGVPNFSSLFGSHSLLNTSPLYENRYTYYPEFFFELLPINTTALSHFISQKFFNYGLFIVKIIYTVHIEKYLNMVNSFIT